MSADHAAEARRVASLADNYERVEHRNGAVGVSEGVESLVQAQIAQVHATLALVEQQRIANLIALLPSLDNTLRVDTFEMDRPLDSERDKALIDIRKGLGL